MFLKSLKKAMTVLLAAGMLSGCSNGGTASAEKLYKAGTYTGISENGMGGKVSVEVKFTDDAIESITVGENHETKGVSDPAIEKMPGRIVEAQSLAVDTVAGATVTSKAILEAVEDAVVQAGGNVDELKKSSESETTAVGEHKDIETDLLVVGGGAAGVSAAVTAATEGVQNIILLEKESALGGNAMRSGGFLEDLTPTDDIALDMSDSYRKTIEDMIAAGPQDDDEATVWDSLVEKYNAYKESGDTKMFDCIELLAIEYHRLEGSPVAANMPYEEVINDFNDWFTNDIGAKYGKVTAIVGYTWPRWITVEGYQAGSGYFANFEKAIKDKNLSIDIMTDTGATALTTDETGRVTGVEAEDKSGNTYTIKADHVLLTTGGFAGNGAMVHQYDTQWGITTDEVASDNAPGVTGDGIRMAQEIGAGVSGMDNIMMFPMGSITNEPHVSDVPFNGSSCLYVNSEGKRFVDETASRFEICHAVFAQKKPMMYILADSLNGDLSEYSEEDIQRSIEKGYFFKGDTIEELAENMGVDPSVLKETVDQYNAAADSLNDELFGRTKFMDGSKIEKGPFYATPMQPVAHITIGGLNTDEKGRVLTEDGNVIKGLFAAGEVASGYCGISAFAWGRSVAKNIIAEAD